jgi:predicted RNase H-like HicB family nuclease
MSDSSLPAQSCKNGREELPTIFMIYGILFEKAEIGVLPPGLYYAHIPALGLTTHGEGIEGAREAAADLATLWLAEKRAAGEAVTSPGESFYSTVEIPDRTLQSA